jgi:hypothetical protein
MRKSAVFERRDYAAIKLEETIDNQHMEACAMWSPAAREFLACIFLFPSICCALDFFSRQLVFCM